MSLLLFTATPLHNFVSKDNHRYFTNSRKICSRVTAAYFTFCSRKCNLFSVSTFQKPKRRYKLCKSVQGVVRINCKPSEFPS